LDRQQRRELHRVRLVVAAVDALGAVQEIVERQLEQAFDLCSGPGPLPVNGSNGLIVMGRCTDLHAQKSSRLDSSMSNREAWLDRCGRAGLSWLGQDCALCGTSSGRDFLCAACAQALPELPEHCPRCALPTPRG